MKHSPVVAGAWGRPLGISAAIALCAGAAWAQTTYQVVDLGALGVGSGAYAVNMTGTAAGYDLLESSTPHAYVFQNGVRRDLGTLGGDASVAFAVNAGGECVGWARLPDGETHAFAMQAGAMHDLGTLGGTRSAALAVSRGGTVVGSSLLAGDNIEVPFVWRPLSGLRRIELPGTVGRALGINRNDEIAGFQLAPDGHLHGFLLRGAELVDLGTLGGSDCKAYALNDADLVVGYSLTPEVFPHFHAVDWRNGVIEDLGALGGTHSVANSVNNAGTIVGFSYEPGDVQVATLFAPNRPVVDLNTLIPPGSGWVLNSAESVNDQGVIVGVGTLAGQSRAFELVPVNAIPFPVPAAGEIGFAVQVTPSVVHDRASLMFTLPHDGDVSVRIVDIAGRSVGNADFGHLGSGQVAVDLAQALPSTARSGVYFAVMRLDGRVRSSTQFSLAR